MQANAPTLTPTLPLTVRVVPVEPYWTVRHRDGTGLFVMSQAGTLLFRVDQASGLIFAWDKRIGQEIAIPVRELFAGLFSGLT